MLPTDQEWTALALCAQTDPEIFHPEKGGSTREAKATCAKCPVQRDCLDYVLAHEAGEMGTHTSYPTGIYGGLSQRERVPLVKARREARLAATGTDAQAPASVATADVDEQPTPPRQYGPPYVGGANGGGHYPLPNPDRVVHIEPRPKPKTIDWDALRAQHEERRRAEGTLDDTASASTGISQHCRWCREPAAELVDDLCVGCRADAEAKFTAPSTPQEEPCSDLSLSLSPAEVAAAPTPAPAPMGASGSNPTSAPAAPTSADDQLDVSAAAQHAATPAAASDAPTGSALPDVAAYCEQLLRDTTTSRNPLVQVLRNNALSALAALDLVAHPEHGETQQAPVAVSAPNPTADRPAAGRHNGTATGTTTKPRRARAAGGHKVNVQAIVDTYTGGHTIREVANTLGHSKGTIRQVLLDEGVTLRDDRKTRSGGRNRIEAYPDELVAAVRTRYLDHQMTQGQVAADLDISVKVVQNVMARHDIPSRPSAVAQSKTGIGRPQKLDDQAVDQIVARYQTGESANALAKAFNVSTPSVLSRLRQRGVQIRSRGGNHPRLEA